VPGLQISTPERDTLVQQWQHKREMRNEYIRQAVLEDKRLDVLCKFVFDSPALIIKPFHHQMMEFQRNHPRGVILAYRGAGKTQPLTIGQSVLQVLVDPNIRILLSSRTCTQAETFLRGIKNRLQERQLTEIFGNQVGDKWDTREINVANRTTSAMESNITTVGIDGGVVSRHFDMIIADDLVSIENSRTYGQREKVKEWYYTELEPTLEEGGKEWIIGTRYHYHDLYGHLIKNEFAKNHLVIPALDSQGRSPWPERHPPVWFEGKRRASGSIVFNCQYMLDTQAMMGNVFNDEHFQYYDEVPKGLEYYQGVDLAIGQQLFHDFFVIFTIAYDRLANKFYLVEYQRVHTPFPEQIKLIVKMFKQYEPIRAGIESNAYQKAVYQELKSQPQYKFVRAHPIFTSLDKLTRMTKLAQKFENGEILMGRDMPELEDELLSFPNGEHDDIIDALDFAISMATLRRVRKTREEPGLL